MAIRVRPAAGIWAKVSIIGSPISRSGAIAFSPSSWLPMQAAAIVSKLLTAERLGHVGDRRQVEEADHGGRPPPARSRAQSR